jgi:hypothetical protein
MAIALSSNETLAIEQRVNQQTDLIIAMATQIYEVGAVYSPVEDGYKVQSPDGAHDAVIVSTAEFHQILSVVRALKSCKTISV